MSKYFIILLITLFACKSRTSNVAKADSISSYLSIRSAMLMEQDIQQTFINKMAEHTNSVKHDTNIVVNTRELNSMLDEAIKVNERKLDMINIFDEVDAKIKYKEKALAYTNYLDTILKNEFNESISILGNSNVDRFSLIAELLFLKLNELERLGLECENASEEFKRIHNIVDMTESLQGQ